MKQPLPYALTQLSGQFSLQETLAATRAVLVKKSLT